MLISMVLYLKIKQASWSLLGWEESSVDKELATQAQNLSSLPPSHLRKPGVAAHACNANTEETNIGRSLELSSLSHPLCTGIASMHHHTQLLYLDSRDSNSGPHTCSSGSLLTDPVMCSIFKNQDNLPITHIHGSTKGSSWF